MTDASAELERLRREVSRLEGLAEVTEQRLRATNAIARALADDAPVIDAMPNILAALGGALDGRLAAFWELAGDNLAAQATWCREDKDRARWESLCRSSKFERGTGLPGRVWAERGPTWLPAVNDPSLPRAAALAQLGVAAGFAFPLSAGGQVLGVVELFTSNASPPDDGVIDTLRTIGGHLGQSMRHAQTTAAAQETARELASEREILTRLDDVARRISSERSLEPLVQAVIDAATELVGAQVGAFFYDRTDHDTFAQYAVSGMKREAFDKLPMPRKTGVFAPTYEGKGVVRVADITKDPRFGKNLPYRGMPEGHVVVRSYLSVPVVTRSGIPIGALLFGHKESGVFTERHQQLASGIAAHAATAMDNAQLHGDAQRLIGELEKTNIELDQFAYVASHDLRAPLRGIANLAQWIEEDLGHQVPKKVAEQLHLLRGRAARMDKLINGLLELARVGRSRQQTERVDVTELLHETIDLASPPATARVLIIGAMPTISAERVAMQQVLLNLIINSLQHAGKKDVVVRITATERTDEIEMAVADNGIGIAPEHHDRVWQMFQTLASRDQVESTGIGLAIVKKQVEANGGRAWIDPAVREGATVRFTWSKRAR